MHAMCSNGPRARETAARVAAGAVAKLLLRELGVEILSHVIQLGAVRSKSVDRPSPEDLAAVDESPVRSFDRAAEAAMIDAIKAAAKEGDSLGGVAEVLAYGVPVGLGSYVHWDRKLDGLLAQALDEHPRGQGGGDRRRLRRRRPARVRPRTTRSRGTRDEGRYRREGTAAGGIEGGMSTGELLVVRAAMKPLATLNRPVLKTVDTKTKEETVSFKERTDVTAVPAMGVVAETMTALVLADGGRAQVRRRLDRRARAQPRRVRRLAARWLIRRIRTSSSWVCPVPARRRSAGSSRNSSRCRSFDSDEAIEAKAGQTVREVFEAQGETRFREARSRRHR